MPQKISKTTYQLLLKHLVDLEEQKDELITTYFPETSDSRDEFEALIREYTKKLESLIKNSEKVEDRNNRCPLVIIGSEVEVEDIAEKERYKFLITPPYTDKVPTLEYECASCLSPIGRALLLRGESEEVEVNTPVDTFRYVIRSIRLPET